MLSEWKSDDHSRRNWRRAQQLWTRRLGQLTYRRRQGWNSNCDGREPQRLIIRGEEDQSERWTREELTTADGDAKKWRLDATGQRRRLSSRRWQWLEKYKTTPEQGRRTFTRKKEPDKNHWPKQIKELWVNTSNLKTITTLCYFEEETTKKPEKFLDTQTKRRTTPDNPRRRNKNFNRSIQKLNDGRKNAKLERWTKVMTLVNESTMDATRLSVCDDWTRNSTYDGMKRGEKNRNGRKMENVKNLERIETELVHVNGEPMRTDVKTKEFRRNLVR